MADAPPPPAPFAGPSRSKLLEILATETAAKSLPLTLGMYEPQAVVQIEDGLWRLRQLTRDKKKAEEIAAKGQKDGFLVPEMFFGALYPATVLIEAKDRASFRTKVEAATWIYGGVD